MMNEKTYQLNRDNGRYRIILNRYVIYCIYATLISNFLILWGNPLKNDLLVSLGTRVMIVFILLLAIMHFFGCFCRKKVDLLDAWFIALVVCTAVLYVVTTFPGILGKMVSYMCFLTLPAYITLYRNVRQLRKLKTAIYIANTAYFFLFLWLSFSEYAYIYYGEYGERIIEELTLGYGNPNETGIYLLICFIIMLCAVLDARKKQYKWAAAACAVVLFRMLWLTESRICLLLAAIMIAVMLIRQPRRILTKIQGIVLIIPLAGVVLTMVLPQSVLEWEFMGSILDTGRKLLFVSFFNSATGFDYLIGDYSRYAGANMHNSFLSIVAMFGIPAAWLYFRFLRQALHYYRQRLNGRVGYVAYAGVLAMIAHGIAEGTILVAGAVYAGLTGLLFVLMLPDQEGMGP